MIFGSDRGASQLTLARGKIVAQRSALGLVQKAVADREGVLTDPVNDPFNGRR